MAITSGVGKKATTAAKTGKTATTTKTGSVSSAKVSGSLPPVTPPTGNVVPDGVVNAPPVFGRFVPQTPVSTPSAPSTPAWSLETDPVYRSAINAGESSFNYARNAALAEKQTTETGIAKEKKAIGVNAAEARRRTAGNYAARGMAGGAAGVASQAEARLNAEQIAAQTDLATQLKAVNDQFLQNYGDVTNAKYDWTGTLVGQQYKTQAAQQALEAALARYGTV